MFILSLTGTHITYEMRDKEDGKLTEPRATVKYIDQPDQILFDNRHLKKDFALHIYNTLL